MAAFKIISPSTPAEWQHYYQFRWQQLRAPWQQPLGSEQDELESSAIHRMILDEQQQIVAVGRVHQLDSQCAQIRYMAVAEAWQGQRLGQRLLHALEQDAFKLGCSTVVLNARESALGFYQRQGYCELAAAPTQFGIVHLRMQKRLRLFGSAEQWQLWCQQLQQSWHQQIPLSDFMQLEIGQFDGTELRCTAPLDPNINLHGTMFAGSIYSLATLTGWGLLHLQLQALELDADLVLADATIRYLRPVKLHPQARCSLLNAKGDLSALQRNRNASQHHTVEIYSGDKVAAVFEGHYKALVKGQRT
ncbi:bifunctional GNAT family N-acetyltransferase/hotdog fold thioesterase [Alkalimonas collagenimarina]|uniref:Bifunctional GNAT family N-acetyltransferase/hotdog fold thioesterase n=1 Tax=Alkalimonas collagenimarina TaxID=400390 RepID=A0ABT9GVG3_9GAMM|nr:bifunctional GNAT family N-acetyltransferase/hotdog fold thioesterase [Alkalimonas collagenimarina]MDP4535047.1 bifunctional GNAT family N-acetyltransferase/hotdog fold thioesterase [Alkalimonas collagenimarina]